MLVPGRALLSSLALQRGDFRLQVRDGLVLALRLVREFAEKLQDFADQMLRPFAGVQYSDYSLSPRRTLPWPCCTRVRQLYAV